LALSTFSIVAYDRRNGDLGVAVQSKFIAVGAVVPWAKAGVGAVATQASANVSYGLRALEMLQSGLTSTQTLERLLREDREAQVRQVAIVDSKGNVAVHTGKKCMNWAGHLIGDCFSCQGNILEGKEVIDSMAQTYGAVKGDLVDRLLSALAAGQKAGGDRRGQQSAAILVVRERGGYEGFTDRYVDLRVDDSPHPIDELRRITNLYSMTMLSREDPSNLVPIAGAVAVSVQKTLKALEFYTGPVTGTYDEATRKALHEFVNVNNFENKMRKDAFIWTSILKHMQQSAKIRKHDGLGRKSK